MENIKEVHQIPNYRKIQVSYLSPSNHRGARICISERFLNWHNPQRKYFLHFAFACSNNFFDGIIILNLKVRLIINLMQFTTNN